MTNLDPAVKHYWFGKAYRDIAAVVSQSWNANKATTDQYWSKMKSAKGHWTKVIPQRAFLFTASVSVMLFGTATWMIAVPIHAMVVLTVAAAVLTVFVFADLIEQAYLASRGWKVYCKNCKESFKLAEYACPNCGVWHGRLRPNSFGIFRHRCNCGANLPSGHFFGRNRLKARCPKCSSAINAAVDTIAGNSIIALIGAPSSGKSAYLLASVKALVESYFPSRGWKVQIDPAEKLLFDRSLVEVRRDGTTSKTTSEQLPAFNMLVDGIGGRSGRRQLYICDLAGEAFQRSERLAMQKQLTHATGAVFLLDPFSLPEVFARHEPRLRARGAANAVSRESPSDVLARAVIALQDHHGIRADGTVGFPLAVLLTKLDLFDPTAPGQVPIEIPDFSTDAAIRSWLTLHGAAGFIQQASTRFSKVRFFAASPLSGLKINPGGSADARAADPILWIFASSSDPLAPPVRSE